MNLLNLAGTVTFSIKALPSNTPSNLNNLCPGADFEY